MSADARWTPPEAVSARVRRRWSDGSLLRAAAGAAGFEPIEVPLRGPTAGELGDDVALARAWADAMIRSARDGVHYDLVFGEIGGRLVGRTRIPVRAVISSLDQAAALLGVAPRLQRFVELYRQTPDPMREWVQTHPHKALDAEADWTAILAACAWLEGHRDQGRRLREITAEGVDTKLVERRRGVVAGLLGVPSGATAFAEALGFIAKTPTVRMRFDPAVLGMPLGFTEAVFRLGELDAAAPPVREALIVENEATYLSVPIPAGGVVLWGRGYDAAQPASLRWLHGIPVRYWGDLDTHGFAILDRVRAHRPQTRSVLMDLETLLAHRDRWGHEETPTNAALPRLTGDETAVYEALVTDRHGTGVRLEQERIDWAWALQRLAAGR